MTVRLAYGWQPSAAIWRARLSHSRRFDQVPLLRPDRALRSAQAPGMASPTSTTRPMSSRAALPGLPAVPPGLPAEPEGLDAGRVGDASEVGAIVGVGDGGAAVTPGVAEPDGRSPAGDGCGLGDRAATKPLSASQALPKPAMSMPRLAP